MHRDDSNSLLFLHIRTRCWTSSKLQRTNTELGIYVFFLSSPFKRMAKRFALILARSRYWDFYYVRFHIRLPFWETLPWGKTKLHRGNETVEFGTTEYNTFRLSKTTCCRLQSSNLLFVVPLSPPCKERYCWVFFCAPRDWYRIEWFFFATSHDNQIPT